MSLWAAIEPLHDDGGTLVTVQLDEAPWLASTPLNVYCPLTVGARRVDDLLVHLVGGVGRVRVEDELAGGRALDDVRALALAVRAQQAARLLRQDDPLVFPSGEVLRRVHREAVEVVVGRRAEEVLSVQVIGVADLDDAAAVRVHQVPVGVLEAHARRVRRRDRRRRVRIGEGADLRAWRHGAALRSALAGGAAGSRRAARAAAAGAGGAAGASLAGRSTLPRRAAGPGAATGGGATAGAGFAGRSTLPGCAAGRRGAARAARRRGLAARATGAARRAAAGAAPGSRRADAAARRGARATLAGRFLRLRCRRFRRRRPNRSNRPRRSRRRIQSPCRSSRRWRRRAARNRPRTATTWRGSSLGSCVSPAACVSLGRGGATGREI